MGLQTKSICDGLDSGISHVAYEQPNQPKLDFIISIPQQGDWHECNITHSHHAIKDSHLHYLSIYQNVLPLSQAQ